jgi:hypothetical protein
MRTAHVQYLPPRNHSVALADARPVRLSDFMVPASIGSAAGFVAGILARTLMDGEHDTTKDAAAYIVNSAVFLLVGGLTWVVRQSRDQ